MTRARYRQGLAWAIVVFAIVQASLAHAENRRIFSYDPANPATRAAAGAITFEFDQHLFSTHVLRIRATEGQATAELKGVGEDRLGRGGLNAAAAGKPEGRDIYEIEPREDGAAMIQALCPGAQTAWLAMDRLRANQGLRVLALGRAKGGPTRLCQTLDFNFRGEWRLPPGPSIDPRTVPHPHFPY